MGMVVMVSIERIVAPGLCWIRSCDTSVTCLVSRRCAVLGGEDIRQFIVRCGLLYGGFICKTRWPLGIRLVTHGA